MDKIEDELGKPTAYQIRSIFAAALLVTAATITPQTGVFYNAVPRHRCRLQPLVNETLFSNLSKEDILLYAIPDGDRCHLHSYNFSKCSNTSDVACLLNATADKLVPCGMGYTYDRTHYLETVVSEWDLVCSNQIWDSFVKSLYFAGALFGAPPTGYLVDWFGRKLSCIVLCFGLLVSGIGCAFAPTFPVYCFFRFLEGMTSLPIMIAAFTYTNEMIGRKYRHYVSILFTLIASALHTLEPLAAFFLRNWRHLNLFFALLTLPFLLICPFIPETPRWLLYKRKNRKAKNVLDRYAKSGGIILDEEDWQSVLDTENKSTENLEARSQFSDMFQRPYTRIVTIISVFLWFSISSVFYGLVLNVGTLVGDPYLNAAINGFTELIALGLYSLLLHKYGSLFCIRTGMFCSGTLCLVAMVAKQLRYLSTVAPQVVRWASIAGKLFVAVAFAGGYQYTPDVNPTVSRGKAMALTAFFGRIGSTVMPFLLPFQTGDTPVGDIVFGILGLGAAASCLLLPNTSRKVFLTTLEEAEDYYRDNMKTLSKWRSKTGDQVRGREVNDAETETG